MDFEDKVCPEPKQGMTDEKMLELWRSLPSNYKQFDELVLAFGRLVEASQDAPLTDEQISDIACDFGDLIGKQNDVLYCFGLQNLCEFARALLAQVKQPKTDLGNGDNALAGSLDGPTECKALPDVHTALQDLTHAADCYRSVFYGTAGSRTNTDAIDGLQEALDNAKRVLKGDE